MFVGLHVNPDSWFVGDNSPTQTSLSKTRDLLALVTGSIRYIWIQDSPPLGSGPGRLSPGGDTMTQEGPALQKPFPIYTSKCPRMSSDRDHVPIPEPIIVA